MKLVPKRDAGAPTGTHTKGKMCMGTTGTLFIGVASSSTVPAKWRNVTTTAV